MTWQTKLQIRNSTAEFLIFTNQAGENSIEICYELKKTILHKAFCGEL